MRYVLAALAAFLVAATLSLSCGSDMTTPSSCSNGPYSYDSNPNVQRCRDRQGQFAQNVCCGR